ncbi:MAG: FMN-binding protein, partial [bacterium]
MKKLLAIIGVVFIAAIVVITGNPGSEDAAQDAARDVEINIDVDGDVYVGYSEFSRGYVEAHVVLDNDEIVQVDLVEYDDKGMPKGEDYSYESQHEAMDVLPERFIEANDADVEIVSGATSTSNKAMEAVEMALAKADGETQFDGTYMGLSEADGNNWGIAIVTVENGNIADVELEEVYEGELKDEEYTYDTFHEAKPVMADRFVEENSYDVDIYSGATMSSDFWTDAVQNALSKSGYADDIEGSGESDDDNQAEEESDDDTQAEEESDDDTQAEEESDDETQAEEEQVAEEEEIAFDDNIYVGYSKVSRGYVEAQVEIEDDEIVDVNLVEYTDQGVAKDESYSYEEYHEAIEELPARFVEANDHDIDVYSGATGTSDKAKEAVEMALEKAEGKTEFDGTFMGVSDPSSRNAWGIAVVTVEDGNITDIKLEESNDGELKDEDNYDYEEFHEAKPAMEERFVEENDHEVDIYSGATSSSEQWMQAVRRALNKAGYAIETHVGYSEVSRGYVEAEVELSGDEILSVNLTEYTDQGVAKDESYSYEEY